MLMSSPVLSNPLDIVDPAELSASIASSLKNKGTEIRPALVETLRGALKSGREEIQRRFFERQDGAIAMAGGSYLMDAIIRALFRAVTETVFPTPNPTSGERLTILAVGGYGRGELAPFSDIDLLFLLPYKPTPLTEQIVEFMLYIFWDLGLKVGHATRSIDETLRQAQADFTIRTGLLEARILCGEDALGQTLLRRFREEIVEGSSIAFTDAKLAERELRHTRMGDSRYVLEPNIKEGKGGLRDLHSLFWIAKYLFHVDAISDLVDRGVLLPQEAHRFSRAQNFLWTIRCHLHLLTGRPEERLTFDVQAEIGRRMGYADRAASRGVERFMKHYFLVAKDVGDLTRIFIAALEAEQKPISHVGESAGVKPKSFLGRFMKSRLPADQRPNQGPLPPGFRMEGGRLAAVDDDIFKHDPVNLLRLFHLAQANKVDIHPHILRAVTRSLRLIDSKLRHDPAANALFMEMLTSRNDPESTLRRMNEAGVLGRFIPEFGRVVSQMQYDMYHVYTVDEHSIFAVGMLQRIDNGPLREELPFMSSIMETVISRRALYLAVFLHDVAKGRPTDHSETGAKIALKLAARLGLDPEETETVSWLIRYHLIMSRTAFKRDLDDPQTVVDFVSIVQSPERLKLLVLLTASDIRAVGPNVWNGWKGALLGELYAHALDLLSGGVIAEGRDKRVIKQRQETRILLPDFSDADFDSLTARAYPYFWLSADTASLARSARLMREAESTGAPLTVTNRVDCNRSVTEISVYTGDHAGLFSRIAGALAVAGARIVDARIVTMTNGMALDTFWVQDPAGGAFDQPDRLAKLSFLFEGVLSGRINPARELKRAPPYPSRERVFTVAPRVLIDNRASAAHTVIEVNGRDRPALLFDLTRVLTQQGLSIASAKITTYGEKVVDVFYVKDVFGLKLQNDKRRDDVRAALINVLNDTQPTRSLAIAS